jgi:sec-independent protein translocase protein TatA
VGLSPTHLLVVALVVLLLFGGNRLADLGKGLGSGLRNFKRGLADDDLSPNKVGGESATAEVSK